MRDELSLISQLPKISILDKNKIAIKYKTKKSPSWVLISWKNYLNDIIEVHKSILNSELKLNIGDKIGIFSNSRYEWSLIDWATQSCRMITVPIYSSISLNDLEYIINDSQLKILFIENLTLLKQWYMIKNQCPLIKKVILIDPENYDNSDPDVLTFKDFLDLNRSSTHFDKFNFESFKQTCESIPPANIATIIYTSGTTGKPKAISLTQNNIYESTYNTLKKLKVNSDDTTLSVLPFSHILGRTEHFGHILFNYTMAFSQGLEKLRLELKEIEPTILVGVPRIFEKIYSSIRLKSETNFLYRTIFNSATSAATQLSQIQQTDNTAPLSLITKYFLTKPILLDPVKIEVFGSNFRFGVCGGAALNYDVALFFHGLGVLILEGYGLTETSGPITVNSLGDYEFGTVGKPIFGANLKINSDGEILVKGPSVALQTMQTSDSYSNDWLLTGDVGFINTRGNLVITERKKDLIKTANGKFIAPQKIEAMIRSLNFINQCHIYGENKKYIVALITLNKAFVIKHAQEINLQFNTYEELCNKPQIQDLIRKGIAQVNHQLSSHETIKNFHILHSDFTIEGGELTPSLKLKRKFIDEKYKKILDSLYV